MAITRKNTGDVLSAANFNEIAFRRQLSGLLTPLTIGGGQTKNIVGLTIHSGSIANTRLLLTRFNAYLGSAALRLQIDAGGSIYTITDAAPYGAPDFVLAGATPANQLWGLSINLVNTGGSSFPTLPEGASYWLELAHVL